MEACFNIAECSLTYAKLAEKDEWEKKNAIVFSFLDSFPSFTITFLAFIHVLLTLLQLFKNIAVR